MKRAAGMLSIIVAAALSISAAPGGIAKLPPKEKRWALLVGVDRYEDPDIGLRGASKDARTLRDALVDTAGFPPNQVIVLATGEPAERQPTRRNIITFLSNLVSKRVPHDGLFVLAFSGHGIDEDGQVYLFPSDVQNGDNEQLLHETAVNVGWIRGEIERNEISQVVFFIDACRNDPRGGRTGTANRMTDAYIQQFRFGSPSRVKAFATLFATQKNQRAYEYEHEQQGYFTWAVVNGLRGEAANEQGEVTLHGLVSYVERVVPERVATDLGSDQIPYSEIGGYRANDIVLAFLPAKVAAPSIVATTLPSIDPRAIEIKVWEDAEKLNTPAAYEEYLRQYPSGIWSNFARMHTGAHPAEGVFSPVESDAAIAAGDFARARVLLQKGVALGDVYAQTQLGRLLFFGLGGACDLSMARALLDDAGKRGSHEAEAWLAYMIVNWGGDIERAMAYAYPAADRGEFLGRLVLGMANEGGAGLAVNLDAANKWYQLALPEMNARVERHDPWAENFLGTLYLAGQAGLPKDEAKALELFRRAEQQGLPVAKVHLSDMYAYGVAGLEKNDQKVITLLKAAAELGHPLAQFSLAWHYANGVGVATDHVKAVELYKLAASSGETRSMINLASIYETGTVGQTHDDVQAVAWYQKAADRGDGYALNRLGIMYELGRGGLPKDQKKAGELYRRSADAGDAEGRGRLAYMYLQGLGGMPKDVPKALVLYRQSANENDANAQLNLGVMYERGEGGLTVDAAQAAQWYRRSADLGYDVAQNALGTYYENGWGGLLKDMAKAVDLYRKAAAQGNEEAKKNLKRLGY